jgi:putative aminopeptidase FrvX
MERILVPEAQTLLTELVQLIRPTAATPPWVSAPERTAEVNAENTRWGSHSDLDRLIEIENQLDQLAEKSAVPGHEGPIRAIVYNALPDWARERAQTDEMGNLWIEMGPAGEATVFIAHTDEVGWEIESIDVDGSVNLTRLGGVVTTAWEGQPALLQLDPNTDIDSLPDAPQLRGVFLTRDQATTRQPDAVRAWFGMNRADLLDAGVRIGMGITGYKEGHRMGPFRYASRALDDRVGTTSLLRAIQKIDPDELSHRVIFAWSVREEGGLRGAGALARRFGMQSRRVYSIDTFVSSDTPLESPHFAFAPLGDGPVLRSIENGGLAIPYELARNKNIASRADIDAQVGLTQGTTDGTAFAFYGAPNAGLSWPGRYSHSPAEIADLRDIAGLIDLILAMAKAPPDTQ